MTTKRHATSRPGYGDRVVLTSSTSGRTWTGVVLVWGDIGCPLVSLDYTADRRWFPPSWITEVIPGEGPPPCVCFIPGPDDAEGSEPHFDPDCPEHGDQAAILRKARA